LGEAKVGAGAGAAWQRPFQLWYDSEASGKAVPVFLVLFVLSWSACLILAYRGVGLHFDTVELYALGQTPAIGHAKHPPLAVWIMTAWTAVFPTADWPLFLLTITNSAIGLFFVDRIARRYVDGDKRLLVLLLATLIPGYHFLAATFNPNALLMSAWPLAVHGFLRSYEAAAGPAPRRDQVLWAIAAGIAAALAMLTKYYTAMLLGAFLAAALFHPARARYFGSLVPWLSIAAGLVVLAPNAIWMLQSKGAPLFWAVNHHAVASRWVTAGYTLTFVLGAIGYLAIPLAIVLALAWPARVAFLRSLVAADPARRMLITLSLALLALPVLTVLVVRTNLPPLWALPGLFLAIIYVMSSPALVVARTDAVRVAAAIAVFWLASIAGAPVHARMLNLWPPKSGQPFHRPASEELDRLWRETTGAPLRIVLGEDHLGWMAAYALPDHPRYLGEFGNVTSDEKLRAEIRRTGAASLCTAEHHDCKARSEALAAQVEGAVLREFTVTPEWWGWPGASARFVAVILPPGPVPAK
jgi:hypothetical protein